MLLWSEGHDTQTFTDRSCLRYLPIWIIFHLLHDKGYGLRWSNKFYIIFILFLLLWTSLWHYQLVFNLLTRTFVHIKGKIIRQKVISGMLCIMFRSFGCIAFSELKNSLLLNNLHHLLWLIPNITITKCSWFDIHI